jgi:uncharacterized protein (DUF433 family)
MTGEQADIILEPRILAGKPVVRGTRLAVEFIIALLADGWTQADILENYPALTQDSIRACLSYARDTVQAESILPTAACHAVPCRRERSGDSYRGTAMAPAGFPLPV